MPATAAGRAERRRRNGAPRRTAPRPAPPRPPRPPPPAPPPPGRPGRRRAARPASDGHPPAAEPELAVAAVAVIEPGGREEPVVAAVGLDLDAFAELWPAVIESIQAERPLLAEHLKVARPAALGERGAHARVGRDAGLSKRKAEDAANRELIGRAIRAVTGASLRLAHELRVGDSRAGRGGDAVGRRADRALRGRVRGGDPARARPESEETS